MASEDARRGPEEAAHDDDGDVLETLDDELEVVPDLDEDGEDGPLVDPLADDPAASDA